MLVLGIASLIAAEEPTGKRAPVRLRGNWFVGFEYSIGSGNFRRVPGLLGRDTELENHLSSNRNSISLYARSQQLSIASASLTGIGAAMVLIAAVVGGRQNNIRWPVIYAAAAPVSAGLCLDFLSSRKLEAAISVFNGNGR